jgi:hypothetical protein
MVQQALQEALIGQILWFAFNEATCVHLTVRNSFESEYAFIAQMKASPFGKDGAASVSQQRHHPLWLQPDHADRLIV